MVRVRHPCTNIEGVRFHTPYALGGPEVSFLLKYEHFCTFGAIQAWCFQVYMPLFSHEGCILKQPQIGRFTPQLRPTEFSRHLPLCPHLPDPDMLLISPFPNYGHHPHAFLGDFSPPHPPSPHSSLPDLDTMVHQCYYTLERNSTTFWLQPFTFLYLTS